MASAGDQAKAALLGGSSGKQETPFVIGKGLPPAVVEAIKRAHGNDALLPDEIICAAGDPNCTEENAQAESDGQPVSGGSLLDAAKGILSGVWNAPGKAVGAMAEALSDHYVRMLIIGIGVLLLVVGVWAISNSYNQAIGKKILDSGAGKMATKALGGTGKAAVTAVKAVI